MLKRAFKCSALALGVTAIAYLSFASIGVATARAQCPAPSVDGNLADMINFANCVRGLGIVTSDPERDVCVTDPLARPCPTALGTCLAGGPYFVNGYDITQIVVARAAPQGSSTPDLFLGYRVVGVIGDSDGDGSPDNGSAGIGACTNPNENISDPRNLGTNSETYEWPIDFDCNGIPNFYVAASGPVVTPGVATVTIYDVNHDPITIPGVTAEARYAGSDIEVVVHGWPTTGPNALPPIFGLAPSAGATSSPDGVSEDFITATPPSPDIDIEIEKLANPVRLCPDASTTITLTVTNRSDVQLTNVSVSDDLPAGIVYTGGTTGGTCGVAEPTIAGQRLSWTIPTLDVDQSCAITFQARRSGTACFGLVRNMSEAIATFQSQCVDGGAARTDVDTSGANLECIDPPCVTLVVVCSPVRACAGSPITVTGTATNCSRSSEDITITIEGDSRTFRNVDPNTSVTHVVTRTMPTCPPPGTVTFNGSATATNECGTSSPPATGSCTVECIPPPAVVCAAVCNPASACPGASITVTGSATNTSDGIEDISLTIEGETRLFEDVPVNGTVSFNKTVTMPQCSDGDPVRFNVSAVATNECPGVDARCSTSCDVECQAPQIRVVKTATPVVEAGGTIHYVITVTNPSTDVTLENVRVTDDLCSNSSNPRNFGGSCPNAATPATVTATQVVWSNFTLAPGTSCVIEFDATLTACNDCINTARVEGFCATARASASDTALTTCPRIGRCWLTGGGQSIDANGDLHSYGGVINPGCSPTAAGGGNWNDLNHTTGAHFKGTEITVVQCGNVAGIPPGSTSPKTPFNFIDFRGTGYITGLNGNKKRTDVFFFGHYEDRAEPGSLGQTDENARDRYFLRVYTNQNDPTGSTVHLVDVDGNSATQDPVIILHGNLQLHISGCDKRDIIPIDRGPGSGGSEEISVGSALPSELSISAARPNPTNLGTEVRLGLPMAAQVSGKVYDVAGRIVRDLGEGPIAAGWHSLRWDLNNESGQRVGPGMYFLRVNVDGKQMMRTITVLR